MNKKIIIAIALFAGIIALTTNSCKDKMTGARGVLNIRIGADLDMLNPLNSTSSDAKRVGDLMFASLESILVVPDYDFLPYMAKVRPTVTEITEGEFKGGMKLDYEIREEAKWDDGKPITAQDYVFTIKCILNPKTNNEPLKGYYEWVGDIVIDSTNPKKFTVLSNKKYYGIEEYAGGYIMPAHIYDADNLMGKFTIREMNTTAKRDALKSNPNILKFAEQFNSEKFQRDPSAISGSGPYKLESWTTGQEVVLVRKDSWWGDKVADQNRAFWAYPKHIKIKIINDDNTAITALKDMQIDNFTAMRAKDFKELEKNSDFTSKFDMGKVSRLSYGFISINMRRDKFKDIKVRQALAHAVNRDKINDIINYGESKKTESFVHSSQPYYNSDLKEFKFDLNESTKLLDEAGWKDTDGDGIRDKVINGKKTPLSIDFKYPKDENTKNIMLIIKEDYKKAGIELIMIEKEWTVFLSEISKRDFDMSISGYTISPRMSDPRQLWSTASAVPGGSNSSGFGNAVSDKMIDDIDQELDDNKRYALYKQFQQIVHDDVPVIFLFNGVNRITTNKKFQVENVMIAPGVFYNEFKAR